MISFRLKAVRAFAGALMVVGVAGGLVVGCDSGVVSEKSQVPTEVVSASAKSPTKLTVRQVEESNALNVQMEAMSIAIAKNLGNKETSQWLHEKCMKRFDGVTNVLLSELEADQSYSWSRKVNMSLPKSNQTFTIENVNATVRQKMNANLHLFWYNAEKWDKSTSPLVVSVPFGSDLKKITELVGFDAQGTRVVVTEAVAEKRPVVILTVNERTNTNGELLNKEYANSAKTKGTAQTNSAAFTLQAAQFPYPSSYYDHWWQGEPEFMIELRDNFWGSLYSSYYFFEGQIPVNNQVWYPFSPIYLNYAPNGLVRLEWWEQDFGWFDGGNKLMDTHYISPNGSSGSQGFNPLAYYVIL